MTRQATWNRIGTDITAASNIKEALDLSLLNYQVEKRPIYLANGVQVPNQFATVKAGSSTVLGIVGKDYEIVQNSDAFAFIDGIIPEGLQFVKAGETYKGNYIIARMPEQYILDDKFVPYIIFQNSHNGSSTLRAAICPLRIVCQNQFAMAFKNAQNKVSLRHSASIHEKLENAQNVLRASAEYMDTFSKKAEELAAIKVSPFAEDRIIEAAFTVKEDAGARKVNNIQERKEIFRNALLSEDNQNFRGTAWGMLQAYTDYITHLAPCRDTEKANIRKFLKVSLDTDNIQNFTNIIMANVA